MVSTDSKRLTDKVSFMLFLWRFQQLASIVSFGYHKPTEKNWFLCYICSVWWSLKNFSTCLFIMEWDWKHFNKYMQNFISKQNNVKVMVDLLSVFENATNNSCWMYLHKDKIIPLSISKSKYFYSSNNKCTRKINKV